MNPTRPDGKPFRLDDMIEQLRDDITVRGKYTAGEFLPSELTLVKQFRLSNKTVRKGLERLMAEGLIEKIPRVGSRVTSSAGRPVTTITLGSMLSMERDMRFASLLEQFESEHPDIRVEIVNFSSTDYTGTMVSHFNAGLLDATMINDEMFWELSEKQDELPLEPLAASAETYSFLHPPFSRDGQLYVRPLIFSPLVLAYNRDHFREAGLSEPDGSWTWDDAVDCAARLSAPGKRYGFCFYPLSNNRWPIFPLQSGMSFAPERDGRFSLRDTKLLDSIRLYKSIVRNRDVFPDYLAESSRDFVRLFRRGQASMILSTYMSLNDFAEDGPNYDISPVPYGNEPRTLLMSIGIAINRRSRRVEAAKRLVDFLGSETAQRFIRERTLSIPAMKKIADAPAGGEWPLNRPARFHLYRNIVPGYRRHKDLRLTPKAFYAFRELLKQYVSDMVDESTLCTQTDEIANGGGAVRSERGH